MPLVTVGISTYNSSNFILETLESIYAQTYQNIELIISDDASSDDTVQKVKDWLATDNRHDRFADVKILEVEENTGVSANANRKLKVTSGEWIKSIGHDDALLPDCVSDNMQYVHDNPDARVVFSKLKIYKNTLEEKNLLYTTPENITKDSIIWSDRSAQSQYRKLLVGDKIHFSPSLFIHRQTLTSMGGYDERFSLLEDYPLWLNLTKNGYKLYFMDKVTVKYRRHAKAINNTGVNYLINPNYFKYEEFRRIYTYPYLPLGIRLDQRYTWYVSQIFKPKWLNKNKKPFKICYTILIAFLNPFRYYIFFKKRFNKSVLNDDFYS